MVEGNLKALLIHYHIFKNAGTTFDSVLARNFGHAFARLDSPDGLTLLSPEHLLQFIEVHPGIRAVSSHTLPPPKPHATGLLFLDCLLLRHPIDRLLSMYEFYRRAELHTDPLNAAAKRLDMAEFFTFLTQSYPQLVNNGQVNYLNGGRKLCREPDLKRALVIARNSAILGVTESFDEIMVAAEHKLSAHFGALDLSYRAQNVTPGRLPDLGSRLELVRQRCGEQLYERLLKLNHLDLELLEGVASEAQRRFEQIPDHRQRMANFVDRCKNGGQALFQRVRR